MSKISKERIFEIICGQQAMIDDLKEEIKVLKLEINKIKNLQIKKSQIKKNK